MRSILLVEDNIDLRETIAEMLTGEGHTCVGADNGIMALEQIAKENRFDLIISDISMPLMGGLEFLAKLNSLHKQIIPAMVMTAQSEKSLVMEALRLGACDFIEKPFHAIDLIARVERILEVSRREQRLAEIISQLPNDATKAFEKETHMIRLLRNVNNSKAKAS